MSMLLALFVLAGSIALTTVTAGPANAYTVQRTPDSVILTSSRLSDLQVHVTVVLELHRSGEMVIRLVDVHNTARTRKWVDGNAIVRSPAAGYHDGFISVNSTVVPVGGRFNFTARKSDPALAARYDLIVNDPNFYARLDAKTCRIGFAC